MFRFLKWWLTLNEICFLKNLSEIVQFLWQLYVAFLCVCVLGVNVWLIPEVNRRPSDAARSILPPWNSERPRAPCLQNSTFKGLSNPPSSCKTFSSATVFSNRHTSYLNGRLATGQFLTTREIKVLNNIVATRLKREETEFYIRE